MQYIIMITVVLGLALADFTTGIIKGYVTEKLSSSKMRKGGLNKLAELIIMSTACGLEIGIEALGKYYNADQLSAITGGITAFVVFVYIVIMELISLLENYSEINPDAEFAKKIIKKLGGKDKKDKEDKEK